MESNKTRKVVGGEGRQMIAHVYHFLKNEYEFTELYREPNCDLSHMRNITKRTAKATGVSERTVQKILKEEREILEKADGSGAPVVFTSPMKNRRKRKNKVDIDERTADAIRSTIQEFHEVQKRNPTLAQLQTILSEKIGFDGCIATLHKLLKKLGYTWHKAVGDKRKTLVEQRDPEIPESVEIEVPIVL